MAAPFPPAPDEAATVALRTVEALLAEGHEVEVISPLPSAADHSGPLAGWRGALLLARRARRYDALHLVVSRRMLFQPELPQARRILDSVALALALRLWRRTSADLGDLSDVPGGGGGISGRLVWGALGEVFVAHDLVRNHAVTKLHFPPGNVKVRATGHVALTKPAASPPISPPDAGALAALPPWEVGSPPDWSQVLGQVRARAALERQRLAREE